MITLTDNAAAAVKSALSQAKGPAEGLRIMVEAGGCAGFKYMMGLETATRDGDAVIESGGVKVFVDQASQAHVAGMTVDFITGLESSGFVFENPNATNKCSCGKSFG
ncbi:iron-sulfur cluster assembly accessory protein [Martelella alba]|uniref:Iron-sulfur cluster assembly accessory protein n=1 Tax=Martelella alba TaxID=2590451 RepID=A0A506U7C9_9HYPH|nr:iron-sulfur cluster assembly accessory protein [Martelella alba]TPW28519.1 iron-sulfur cluster assembly accessory protein [Martelella alba]